MEDRFYERLKENEEKVKRYGPHISGLVNAGCNIFLYPFFQLSTQLQLSYTNTPSYIGKSLKEQISSMLFYPNPSNVPYNPPKFSSYKSAILYNSLQGYSSFYKGFFHGLSMFYLGILSRTFATSAFYDSLKGLSVVETIAAGILYIETLISTTCELVFYPLFVAQTRLINQNHRMKTFSGVFDMFYRCGLRSMYAGWGGILPRQLIFALWSAGSNEIDRFIERIIGSRSLFEVFIREIVVGGGGFMLAYPILTASRRVAAGGQIVGMPSPQFTSVAHALFKIGSSEGHKSLFRGFASFSLAVLSIQISLWVLFMPTFTQWTWLKIGPSREDILNDFSMD